MGRGNADKLFEKQRGSRDWGFLRAGRVVSARKFGSLRRCTGRVRPVLGSARLASALWVHAGRTAFSVWVQGTGGRDRVTVCASWGERLRMIEWAFSVCAS